MRVCVIHLSVVLLLSCFSFNTAAKIENGKYSILVSISQNVPSENLGKLIENLKGTFQDASRILHGATGLQFSKVTFKVPASLDISRWKTKPENYFKIDFNGLDVLVDNTNDTVFGKFPFSVQYGNCGTKGSQIVIPTAFFSDDNRYPRGISFAREWLKYRFGVFDENGYFQDPLYPLYYNIPGSDENDIKVTDCTNVEVAYKFNDHENDCTPSEEGLRALLNAKNCSIHVNGEDSKSVTSSFMFYREDMPNMQHICGRDQDHKHNSRSPNKQNALCTGRSIWDVISNSREFKDNANNNQQVKIEFDFVQEMKPRVVLAWENTANLKDKGEIILKAVNKFIIDLPSGSKLSAFPFRKDLPDKVYTLDDLNSLDDRRRIAGGILSVFNAEEDGSNYLAVKKAVEILKSNAEGSSKVRGDIIIVTGTSSEINDSFRDLLNDINVCLKLISIGKSAVSEEIKKYVTDLSCGEVDEFISDEPKATLQKLIGSLESIYSSKVQDKVTETVTVGYLSRTKPVTVESDETVETVTFCVFSEKETQDFKLTLNSENANATSSELIGKVVEIVYSPSEAGTVELTYPLDTSEMLTEVRTTSRPGEYFTTEVLLHDTTVEGDIQMPVIIYAVIRYGAYPVQNAKVSATIQRPNAMDFKLDLHDDGKGDPDITQHDGIYSGYFIYFSGKGKYTVTVTAQSDGDSIIGKDENTGYYTCCGSTVTGGNQTLSKFSRSFSNTFEARSGRPTEGYNPSRISDLRVDEVQDDKIILKWTAPGGEADTGKVNSYEIKWFSSQEDAISNFSNGGSFIKNTISPKTRGESETLEIKYNDFEKNTLYYIAMKATRSQKTSDLSNVIEIFIPDRQTTDSPDTSKITQAGSKKTGLIVGLIVGLMVLVIILCLAIYFLVVKPKRKEKKKEKENPIYAPSSQKIEKTETNGLNPITFVSADTLIKHHNEKIRAKNENKEPPVFREEDFQERSVDVPHDSNASSDDQQPRSSKEINEEQPLPPKSPRRTTYV